VTDAELSLDTETFRRLGELAANRALV